MHHHIGERYARRYYISPRVDEEQNSNDELVYNTGDNKEPANRYLSEEIFSEDINFNNLIENKSYLHYNDLEVRQARHEHLSRLKSSRGLNQLQKLDSNKNSNSEGNDYRNVDRVCYILPTNMNSHIQSRRPSAEILRKLNPTSSQKSDSATLIAQNYQELRSKEIRDRNDDSSPFNETKSAPTSQNNSEKILDVEKSIQSHHFEEAISTRGSGTLKHNQKCRPEDVKVTYKNEAFKKVSSQTDMREVLQVRLGRKAENFSGTTFIHHKENRDGLATYSPKILTSEFPQPHESPSKRSMQTVQSKKYDDLIKLELSKCTIMSVIYDGLQKCEQSKYEVLPNEKNISKVTADRIQRKVEEEPSPSISIGKLDTASNTEIVTADLLSNVFKDIRDIHLQNILHAVKCIQYVENIPKKYGAKRGI